MLAGTFEVTADDPAASSCVEGAKLRAALDAEGVRVPERLSLVQSSTTAGRVSLDLELKDRGEVENRVVIIRGRDCRLAPRLLVSMVRRFTEALPAPALSTAAATGPGWPSRTRAWLRTGVSPGLFDGAPQVALRAGVSEGDALGWAWVLSAGGSLVPDIPFAGGRAELWSVWAGGGLGWEGTPLGVGLHGSLLLTAGASRGRGRGFDQTSSAWLPLAKARWDGAIVLADPRSALVPEVGLAATVSAVEVVLVADEERRNEPLVRFEVFVGVAFGTTSPRP